MALTPRDIRYMTRMSRHLVEDVCDAHKSTIDVKNDYIKHLEARCELQEKALKQFAELKHMLEKQASDSNTLNRMQIDLIKTQDKILLRAYHLELHAEYRSLGYPPVPNARLPDLLFNDWHYFRNMEFCTDNEEIKKVEELKNFYFDRAVDTGDFRIPSVHALINDLPVPHPPGPVTNTRPTCFKEIPHHLSHFPVTDLPSSPQFGNFWSRHEARGRGKRAATPCPYEGVTTEDESIDEFWIESARQQGDGSGPSSTHEYNFLTCVLYRKL